MRRLAPFFIVTRPALRACGGVWTEASKRAVGQTCRELPGRLQGVPDGPDKARMAELLDQCASAGDAGQIGIIGVAKFSTAGAACLREYYHRCREEHAGRAWREAKVFEKAYKIHLFQEMIEAGERMVHVDTPGGYIEVDTQQDFEYARRYWTAQHLDRKSTRLNSSHTDISCMPSSA